VAALSVLCAHLYDMPLLAGFLPDLPAFVHWALNLGGRGVELFFVISGYVISASLARHRSVMWFFYDRALRILPLFYALNLIVFAVGPIVGYKFFKGVSMSAYLQIFSANMLFLPDLTGLPWAQQNAWTLAWEWVFYILFAAAFYLSLDRRRLAAFSMVAAGGALAIAFPVAIFFAVGIFLRRFESRLASLGNVGVVVGVACLVAMYVLIDLVHPYAAVLPAIIVFAAALSNSGTMARILSSPALLRTGDISYSLYLTHPFVLFPLQMAGVKLATMGVDRWALWAAFVVIGAPVSIFVSARTHQWVDVALRRRLDDQLRAILPARRLVGAPQP
jgi:peptidoglycan/LPS O-acetylase OafA/YrhL